MSTGRNNYPKSDQLKSQAEGPTHFGTRSLPKRLAGLRLETRGTIGVLFKRVVVGSDRGKVRYFPVLCFPDMHAASYEVRLAFSSPTDHHRLCSLDHANHDEAIPGFQRARSYLTRIEKG